LVLRRGEITADNIRLIFRVVEQPAAPPQSR
jgi:hypothetical protein